MTEPWADWGELTPATRPSISRTDTPDLVSCKTPKVPWEETPLSETCKSLCVDSPACGQDNHNPVEAAGPCPASDSHSPTHGVTPDSPSEATTYDVDVATRQGLHIGDRMEASASTSLSTTCPHGLQKDSKGGEQDEESHATPHSGGAIMGTGSSEGDREDVGEELPSSTSELVLPQRVGCLSEEDPQWGLTGTQQEEASAEFTPRGEPIAPGHVKSTCLVSNDIGLSRAHETSTQQILTPSKAKAAQSQGSNAAELQALVWHLQHQIDVTQHARDDAVLSLQQKEKKWHEDQEAMKKCYEERLQERQREVLSLRMRVQTLESQGPKGKLLSSVPGGDIKLSAGELAALKKEVQETERLLAAYQGENENAMKKIKDLQHQLNQAKAVGVEECQKLERQLLQVQEDARRHHADHAHHFKAVLDLQAELQATRDHAEQQALELKGVIEKLRAEKKVLEGRSAGVDVQQMVEGDLLVKQVKGEMESMRRNHNQLVASLQGKLQWYVENQALLTKNDALVAEQASLIKELESRLAKYEGRGADRGLGNSKGQKGQKIKQLEEQVAVLQKALQQRFPNSLPAVLAATRPAPEESLLVQQLQDEIRGLREELGNKDDQYELKLRALQQQYDQLKVHYQEKMEKADAAAKSRTRAKELEKQLEDQRGMYTRRIRNLELRLQEALGAQKKGGVNDVQGSRDAPPSARKITASQWRQKEEELKKLKGQLEEREKEVTDLQSNLRRARQQFVDLEEHVRKAIGERATGAAGPSSPDPSVVSIMPGPHAAQGGKRNEDETLKRRLEAAEAALQALQQAHAEVVERCTHMSAQHNKEILQIREETTYREAMKWQDHVQYLEHCLASSQSKVEEAERELDRLSWRAEGGPDDGRLLSLERKVRNMEAQHEARETHWQAVLANAEDLHRTQMEMLRRQGELAVQEKNAEIQKFRFEVDALLHAAKMLKEQRQWDQNYSGPVQL